MAELSGVSSYSNLPSIHRTRYHSFSVLEKSTPYSIRYVRLHLKNWSEYQRTAEAVPDRSGRRDVRTARAHDHLRRLRKEARGAV